MIPPALLLLLGFAAGAGALLAAYTLFMRGMRIFAEVAAGLGAGLIYGAFFYASYAPEIAWPHNTLLVCELMLTALVFCIAYRFEMRILALLGVGAGLLVPAVLGMPEERVLWLFSYVLILNLGALGLSLGKKLARVTRGQFSSYAYYLFALLRLFTIPHIRPNPFSISAYFIWYMHRR